MKRTPLQEHELSENIQKLLPVKQFQKNFKRNFEFLGFPYERVLEQFEMRRPSISFSEPWTNFLSFLIEIQIEINQILFWTSPDQLEYQIQEMKGNEEDIAPRIWIL